MQGGDDHESAVPGSMEGKSCLTRNRVILICELGYWANSGYRHRVNVSCSSNYLSPNNYDFYNKVAFVRFLNFGLETKIGV